MAAKKDTRSEVPRPQSLVIIGGLVSATILTLIVLPTVVLDVSRRPRHRTTLTEAIQVKNR